jgi:hypothetical protein
MTGTRDKNVQKVREMVTQARTSDIAVTPARLRLSYISQNIETWLLRGSNIGGAGGSRRTKQRTYFPPPKFLYLRIDFGRAEEAQIK